MKQHSHQAMGAKTVNKREHDWHIKVQVDSFVFGGGAETKINAQCVQKMAINRLQHRMRACVRAMEEERDEPKMNNELRAASAP